MQGIRNHALAMFSVGTVLFIGLIGAGRAAQAWATIGRLQEEGILIEADIESKRNLEPLARSSYVTVMYTIDAEVYTRENRIRPSEYETLNVGDTITLRYDPADPSIALQPGNALGAINLTVTSAVWILGGMGAALFYTSTMRRLQDAHRRNAELWDQAADRIAQAAEEIRAEQAAQDSNNTPPDAE